MTAKRKRLLCTVLSGLMALFIIIIPVSAEMRSGYVSNLLSPLYGGVQTELVDGMGRPIDASAAMGEYVLSADGIIGDRYNVAIVYTLRRTDGGVLPENIRFREWEPAFRGRASGGGSLSLSLNPSRTKLMMVEQWTTDRRLFKNRQASVAFTDLMDGEKLLVEGHWELAFAARYKDSTVRVPAGFGK